MRAGACVASLSNSFPLYSDDLCLHSLGSRGRSGPLTITIAVVVVNDDVVLPIDDRLQELKLLLRDADPLHLPRASDHPTTPTSTPTLSARDVAPEPAGLRVRKQSPSASREAGAGGAADAVDVGGGAGGDVVVDDDVDRGNIETSV